VIKGIDKRAGKCRDNVMTIDQIMNPKSNFNTVEKIQKLEVLFGALQTQLDIVREGKKKGPGRPPKRQVIEATKPFVEDQPKVQEVVVVKKKEPVCKAFGMGVTLQ
jgi:hypothetical protein